MKEVLALIGEDLLDEAIEKLSEISAEINDVLKELILLKARLTNVNRDSRKGILKEEDKELEKNKIREALIELTFKLGKQIQQPQEENFNEDGLSIPPQPYPEFSQSFREVVAPHYISSSKSYMHIVFGDISKIENSTIVVGCSQDFDMRQSNPRSALGSLWQVKMNDNPLLIEIDNIWAPRTRPKSSGLGTSKYIKLQRNSNNLEGIIFTVTTRDVSRDIIYKGLYTNTPLEGIPFVLSKVFTEARKNCLSSIALPLLGAGFANIARTYNNPNLKFAIEKAALAITIDESLNQLIGENKDLRRIIIVIYSDSPQSNREHELWELSIKMLTPNTEKRLKIIDDLVNKTS